MRDSIRVSVESDSEEASVHVHDDAGEVATDGVTFRFSIDGADVTEADTPSDEDTSTRAHEGSDDGERDPRYIAPVTEIPTDSTLRCTAVDGNRTTEIILRRERDAGVFAWRNSCPHKPNVPLDPGDGAIIDDDRIVCHAHGARFECGDGFCTAGPCRGDALDEIDVEVRDSDVYLSDERFAACNLPY
ncbi:Rieske (2Fe-2S) protein [Halopenitus persicus]|uniref:Ferredoxin subunit of nitrite reductase or a ring-hydroxylating dioxygenase n=1 Tax=Halopenitus persicus TaxID=1048396 RepID=A0A1H3M9Q4_9EURY|nr:Rieske 2Fe-2S domain-containing protein [Halopenitus persicus]SDY73477.1 Ferredoxin subunit of nitrite reductase or a ring-hydroxylating dioxygenase [Halopenitus persicus]